MTLNINTIGMSPRLLQVTSRKSTVQELKSYFENQNSQNQETLKLSDMASHIKSSYNAHDTKTADLTNVEEDAATLAGGVVMDATTQGLLGTILKRTVGVPGISDADKIISETLKNVKDPSIVKNVENAWADWKKDYYKNGNISFGQAVKSGINLIPTMGRGICNGILETGTKVAQQILGDDGVQVVSDGVHSLSNGIKTIGDTVVAPFSGLFNIIKGNEQAAHNAFNKVWTDLKNTGKSLKDTAVSITKYVSDRVTNFVKNPAKSAIDTSKRIIKGVKTAANTVKETVKNVGKKICGLFKGLF